MTPPPDFAGLLGQIVSAALPWVIWSSAMTIISVLLAYYGVGLIFYLIRGNDPFRSRGSLLLKKEIFSRPRRRRP